MEKAREATDLANIRSAYAECSAEALTATADVAEASAVNGVAVTIDSNTKVITAVKKVKMTQQKAGYAAGATTTQTIGGVVLDNAAFKLGTATITVKSDGTKPTIVIA